MSYKSRKKFEIRFSDNTTQVVDAQDAIEAEHLAALRNKRAGKSSKVVFVSNKR
jgi:hypothetical protein